MSQKSLLDQILDILEKWEEGVAIERPHQESSFPTQKKTQQVGRKEKTMLLLWSLFCFAILTIISSLLIDGGSGMTAVIGIILSLVIYFVLFIPVLYWYLNKAGKDKRWLLISIFPFLSFLFIIYLVAIDQTDKRVIREALPEKKNSEFPQPTVQQKKRSFFDFTPDDRFKR